MSELGERIRAEAALAARPGQAQRLDDIAMEVEGRLAGARMAADDLRAALNTVAEGAWDEGYRAGRGAEFHQEARTNPYRGVGGPR